MKMRKFISDVPQLTAEEMRKIDSLMVRKYTVKVEMMMENAGRALTQITLDKFLINPVGKNILILAGKGGNGGGALAAARHLFNRGAKIQILIPHPNHNYKGATANHLMICKNIGCFISQSINDMQITSFDLVIDGLFGYGITEAPRDNYIDFINWVNERSAPIISNDIPSGLNPNTGEAYQPCIKADATVTVALPKVGLAEPRAGEFTGEIYLADIGVPPKLYKRINPMIDAGYLFGNNFILRLDRE